MTIVTLGLDLGRTGFTWRASTAKGASSYTAGLTTAVARSALKHAALLDRHGGVQRGASTGRALEVQGHTARLMPQYVKPFVKANKNDYRDAEANAEAVQRPTMRFVPLKTGGRPGPSDDRSVRQRRGPAHGLINQLPSDLAGTGDYSSRNANMCWRRR